MSVRAEASRSARRDRWADLLLPSPFSPTFGEHPRRRAGLLVAMTLAGIVLALFRVPRSSWNILWAEDGTVFVQGALSGDPHAILTPYAGYFHILPRLEAVAATRVPLDAVPTAVVVLAAITLGVGAVGLFVFVEHRLASPWLRFAAWLSLVSLPVAGAEVADSIANLHWYLIVIAFWAALVRGRSRGVVVVQCVAVATAVLCDPLALIVLPIVVARVIVRPWRAERALALTVTAAAVIQLAGVIADRFTGSARTFGLGEMTATRIAGYFATRVTLGTVAGVRGTMTLGNWTALAFAAAAVAGLGLAILIVVAAVRSQAHRSAILLLVAASAGFALVILVLQGRQLAHLAPFAPFDGGRYYLVPICLMTGAVLLSVDALIRGWRVLGSAIVGAAVLIWVAALGVSDYRSADVRAGTPSWTVQLDHAEQRCARTSDRDETIATAPSFFPGTTVSCAIVMDAR